MPAFLLLPPALSCCFRSWLNILSDLHVIVNWFSWGFQCSFSRTPRVSQPLHTFRRLVSSPTRIRHLGLAGVPLFFWVISFFVFYFLFFPESESGVFANDFWSENTHGHGHVRVQLAGCVWLIDFYICVCVYVYFYVCFYTDWTQNITWGLLFRFISGISFSFLAPLLGFLILFYLFLVIFFVNNLKQNFDRWCRVEK